MLFFVVCVLVFLASGSAVVAADLPQWTPAPGIGPPGGPPGNPQPGGPPAGPPGGGFPPPPPPPGGGPQAGPPGGYPPRPPGFPLGAPPGFMPPLICGFGFTMDLEHNACVPIPMCQQGYTVWRPTEQRYVPSCECYGIALEYSQSSNDEPKTIKPYRFDERTGRCVDSRWPKR